MRIYIASLWQETNTFSPLPTELDLFESGYRLRGREIIDRLAGTNTEIGGFLECFEKDPAIEVIPGTAAWATPSGKISRVAFDTLVSDLIEGLRAHLPVDGVLLALHGALVGEHIEDCEGYILNQVRKLVGPKVPLVSSLDYHACLTKQMTECADVLVGYRTYPHIDYAETGFRAATALSRLLKDRSKLTVEFRKLPLMLPAENTETESGPMAAAIQKLKVLDANSTIAAASIFTTQPWLDVAEHGVSVLLYSIKGTEAAASADEIANYLWKSRPEFFLKFKGIREYLDSADQYARPAVVVDSGDITSAGALGDSTEILRALLERNSGLRSVLTMVDPTAVMRASEIGEGRSGKLVVGGRENRGYNAATQISARVVKLSNATVSVKGHSFSGMELNMGRRALLDIGGAISLIVHERTSLLHDPEILRSMSIHPENYDLIAQKSHKLFRAAYKTIAKSVTILDTPGFSDMNLKRLPFKQVRRPIYPLDEM
jgi:microcystin degradation protein MlrC